MDASAPAPDSHTTQSLIERLDRLPFTRQHGRLLGASGIGWAFDAFDVGLISFVIAALGVSWNLSDGEKSWIVAAGAIGMAIGATAGGRLADIIGRKTVFAATLVLYGLATGASAFTTAAAALIALRVVVGIGLGAELPVASTLVSEFSPRRLRGRIVVWLEAFWALGWLLAAVVGYLVVPNSDNGWRWALAIGALPALYAVALRWHVPESPLFLIKRGKVAQADAVVAQFEASPAMFGSKPADGPAPADEPDTPTTPAATGLGALWSAVYRRRTIAIWVTWFMVNFSYYGAFIWIPSMLAGQGHSLVKSFEFTLIITLAQVPGYAAAALLIEKWGRRPVLVVFLLGSAVSAGLFGSAGSTATLLIFGSLLSFFNLGAWGALYAVTPEIYPTALRGTGAGLAAGVGRVASVIAPFVVPAVLRSQGGDTTVVFVIFAVAFIVAAVAATALPEKRGQALEA